MKQVDLYTDGACSFNPGPGGYGIVLIYKGHVKEFSGFEDNTTNNRMELLAVIEGLLKLKEPCDVTIYTDSAYVCNAFLNNWVYNWQKNNWKTAGKKDVKNVDLWMKLLNALQPHKVKWVKVKGHSDNVYNNMCDKLARAEVDKHLAKVNSAKNANK